DHAVGFLPGARLTANHRRSGASMRKQAAWPAAFHPMRADWILGFATVLIVLCTLLPLWRHPGWWIRCWDFPRVQLTVLAALLVGARIVWREPHRPSFWIMLTATGACIIFQLIRIWPYT